MKKPDSLFELVKSLSKGEKRNFKLYTRLQGTNKKNYIRLFDRLESLEVYEEFLVKKQLKIRDFAYTKNYLYNTILKSLTVYEEGEGVDIGRGIHMVQLLIDKNLFDQALKKVKTFKKRAEELELFYEWEKLLDLEFKIYFETHEVKKVRIQLDYYEAEKKRVSLLKENLEAYKNLYYKLSFDMKIRFLAREESDVQEIEEIKKHSLVMNESFMSDQAAFYFNRIKENIARYEGDTSKSIDFAKINIELFEKSKHLITAHFSEYIELIQRIGLLHITINEFEIGLAYFESLKKLNWKTGEQKLEVFEKYYPSIIVYCVDSGNTELGLKTINELERELPKYESKIAQANLLTLYYFTSQLLLISERYLEAIKWLTIMFQLPRTELRKDLRAFGRIMFLILLFETENWDLLEYEINATYKYLTRHNRFFKFESTMLRFLRKFGVGNYAKNKTSVELQNLREQLTQVFKNPMEKRSLDYFNTFAWIESKLLGKPMSEILRKKELSED